MFNRLKKRYEAKTNEARQELNRISFERNMHSININLKGHTDSEKISLLSFLTEAIKRDIQGYYLAGVINAPYDAPVVDYPFPNMYCDEMGAEFSFHEDAEKRLIDLASTVVITCPWDLERYLMATINVLENGFEYMSDNQYGVYYDYLNMGYLYNGLHHVSVASILKKGEIKLPVCDIRDMFKNIHTDGLNWYNSHSDTINRPVSDRRFALLYRLCEMKYELEKG